MTSQTRPSFGSTEPEFLDKFRPTHTEQLYPQKRRIFMWVFLAVQALFLIVLAYTYLRGNSPLPECAPDDIDCALKNFDQSVSQGITSLQWFAVATAGWLFVDLILGINYVIYRLAKRP